MKGVIIPLIIPDVAVVDTLITGCKLKLPEPPDSTTTDALHQNQVKNHTLLQLSKFDLFLIPN
ncbi:hypothetical protein C4F50_15645 [Flavobacterium sp. KB82]|uniref:Uncharacterized protein n=1 Tax=Flavobacterium hungaricum TaxID=2082725 RepID=A0ABR9TLY7_9FLAO|nr:hypothetical protein [Flavobacterium hungaricum]